MYLVTTGIGTVQFDTLDDLLTWINLTDRSFKKFEITIEKK